MKRTSEPQHKERFTMRTLKMLLPALALGVMATSAQAAITIPDTRNFEGGTDGTAFNTGVYNINATSALVEADGSAQSPFHLNGLLTTTETKGVVLNNTSTSTSPQFGADISNYDASATQYVQFDFKAFNISHNAAIQFRAGTGGTGTQGALLHLFSASGSTQNREGASGANTFVNLTGLGAGTLSEDVWYRYTLTLNPINTGSDTYDVRVQTIESTDLDVTNTGLAFRNNIADINSFYFFSNTGPGNTGDNYAVDNVRVVGSAGELNFDVIPEPSSLALLAAGGLLVARRRRH